MGTTAAEIIIARADATKPNMGLTSWAGDVPRRADVAVAKNYLDAVAKAEREYAHFSTQRAASPSPIEAHFSEALREVKQLEKKRTSRPKGSKKR